jgi:glycine betaine/proline transport system permease protein
MKCRSHIGKGRSNGLVLTFPHLHGDLLHALKKASMRASGFSRAPMATPSKPFQSAAVFPHPLRTRHDQTPWPIIMALVALLAWLGNCSIKIVLGSLLTPFLIGLLNMWDDTMKTISMESLKSMFD